MPTDPPAGASQYPGGCLQPVLLRGRVDHIDGATGEPLHRYTTVHEPGGVLPIACKTRRTSRCPPCAEVYRADTYQLIHAGLSGGKGVPATVAEHPCVFTTLTAPSFGPVHVHREKDGRLLRCRPRRRSGNCSHGRRMSCPERHTRDDPRIGEPLCPDCYDYTGAVLFNACAPELWRRFTITLRRSLARQAGLTGKALAAQVRVSYAKVAEYQRRGVVHFHAIIRLDGPAGPATPPPTWGYQPGGDGLFALVRGAVGAQHAKGGGVGTASTVTPRSSSPNGNSPDATSRSPTCPARSVCRAPPPAVKGWTRLPDTDRLLTVAQAAELLATSERFPRRLIAERRIRFVRLGESGKRGHVRIPESALREFIAAGLIEPLTTPHARRAA